MTPKWKHHTSDQQYVATFGDVDVYHCPEADEANWFVVRWGDHPGEGGGHWFERSPFAGLSLVKFGHTDKQQWYERVVPEDVRDAIRALMALTQTA